MANAGAQVLQSEDVRALTDLGFLALSRGLDLHAMAMFEGVRAARPEQEAGQLGIALVHMYRGDLDTAALLLRKLGPTDAARTFLGIALARQGAVVEAREILEDVTASVPDTPFSRLAQDALQSIGPAA
jgi:hypothetical protein